MMVINPITHLFFTLSFFSHSPLSFSFPSFNLYLSLILFLLTLFLFSLSLFFFPFCSSSLSFSISVSFPFYFFSPAFSLPIFSVSLFISFNVFSLSLSSFLFFLPLYLTVLSVALLPLFPFSSLQYVILCLIPCIPLFYSLPSHVLFPSLYSPLFSFISPLSPLARIYS